MNTERTRVRPRMRGAENAPRSMLPPVEAVAQDALSSDELSGLPVLARLPDVSASNRTLLTQQLDWLKKLDWKRVRQMNFDPNWVAGGVLALVLFLLLVITLNRTPKPAPEAAAPSEAPSWKDGAKAAAPTTLSATSNIAATSPTSVAPGRAGQGSASAGVAGGSPVADGGPMQGAVQQGLSNSSHPLAAAQPAENPLGQFSLEGVFYPRTPYPAPVGHPTDHAANQPPGSSFGRELRTAQREVVTPHYAPVQPSLPQPGRAQLEGTISQP